MAHGDASKQYIPLESTGSISCDSKTFGDPAAGVTKQCWCQTPEAPAASTNAGYTLIGRGVCPN